VALPAPRACAHFFAKITKFRHLPSRGDWHRQTAVAQDRCIKLDTLKIKTQHGVDGIDVVANAVDATQFDAPRRKEGRHHNGRVPHNSHPQTVRIGYRRDQTGARCFAQFAVDRIRPSAVGDASFGGISSAPDQKTSRSFTQFRTHGYFQAHTKDLVY
jgi:hypothetical protein